MRAENFTTGPAANIVNVGYGAQSRPVSNFAAVCRTTTTRTNRAKARSLNAPGLECSQYRDTKRNTLYSEKCDARLVGVSSFFEIDKISRREFIAFVNFLRVVYLNYCEVISVNFVEEKYDIYKFVVMIVVIYRNIPRLIFFTPCY